MRQSLAFYLLVMKLQMLIKLMPQGKEPCKRVKHFLMLLLQLQFIYTQIQR